LTHLTPRKRLLSLNLLIYISAFLYFTCNTERVKMSSYTSNLQHFLDKNGDIPLDIHPEGRKMASFLTSVVDRVTASFPFVREFIKTGLKCMKTDCRGAIIGHFRNENEPIVWQCMKCSDFGSISDWQNSHWDKATNKIKKTV